MDVSGLTGGVARPPDRRRVRIEGRTHTRRREVEHVEIRFTGFVASEVAEALEAIRQRKRLSRPLLVDLELNGGDQVDACQTAGFWGGAMSERWFGIDLDLDGMAAGRAA